MSLDTNKKAKIVALVFVALIIIICGAIILPVCILPYDSGILSSANLSGNLAFDGEVCETADYVFYIEGNKIIRYDKGGKQEQLLTIYESKTGTPSCLNPYDGWLWFCDNNRIFRIAYYGQLSQEYITPNGCTRMSLNGSWLYFKDAKDGKVYKMRDNGKKLKPVTNIPVDFFACDNRKIIFTDLDKNLHSANTDGTDDKIIDTNVTAFTYTLDELFYLKNGVIEHISSLAAGYDAGLPYTPEKAEIFNYNTDSATGRGRLYFYRDNTIYCKLLASERIKSEQLIVLVPNVENVKKLYSINGKIYYGDNNKLTEFNVNGYIADLTPTDATATDKTSSNQ